MDINILASASAKKQQKCIVQRKDNQCEICGRPCQFRYYRAGFSCESCKQFFRRIIMKQKELVCWKGRDCEIDCCRSCRFDKCLGIGMDYRSVAIGNLPNSAMKKDIRHYFCLLDQRRGELANKFEGLKGAEEEEGRNNDNERAEELLEIERPFVPSGSEVVAIRQKSIPMLAQLEQNLHQIWLSDKFLPADYIQKHDCFAHFLQDSNSILGMAKEFLSSTNEVSTRAKSKELPNMFLTNINLAVKDRLLIVEIVKTMSFFRKLEYSDQVRHLRHIIAPLTMFFNSFYTVCLGEDTWSRANGFKNITRLLAFFNCKRVTVWAEQLYCDPVKSFKQTLLTRDEFVLLLATLMANSTASDLSESARQILYEESVFYSKSLLDLLQTKYGTVSGTQKYAQAMHLITLAFQFDYRAQLMWQYLDVVYLRWNDNTFPRVFWNTPLATP